MIIDVIPSRRKSILAAALASAALALPAAPAAAQAVVQPVPPRELGDLQAALATLSREPTNLDALLGAGKASIALNDLQAALGFFRRAQAVSPDNAAAKAGMAAISLRQGNPVEAVALFDEADRGGLSPASYASDHGLALDLVGDNQGAQRFYRAALAQGDDPEVIRRLALSQAIAGDQRGSEATLLPLLQHSDLAAYRTRAFALAILGRGDEAVSIAETMLPERLSNRMAPYLRYMPRLTRAQQAAAANLGQFPPADDIGRDSEQIAALSARSAPQQVAARTPDARLEPTGEPLGSGQRSGRRGRDRPAPAKPASDDRVVIGRVVAATSTPIAPPPPAPAPAPTPTPAPAPVEVASTQLPPSQAPASPPPVLVASAEQPARQSVPEPVQVAVAEQQSAPAQGPPDDAPRPSFSITESRAPAAAAAEPPAEPELSLAEAFADFADKPATAARPQSGAVDITKIEPAREKPAPPPAPKPPPNPKRYWVQVATGRDTKALAFDWRRIKREGGEILKSSDAFTASWGQTNRLLTGPYGSEAEALKEVRALKAKGLDSFAFTSAAGEEVRPLK